MTDLIKRMTWPLILLAIVSCLLMIAPVTAFPATLTGTIIDGSTSLPVSNATVTLGLPWVGSATTGIDGTFTINFDAIVPPGLPSSGSISVSKDGYDPYPSSPVTMILSLEDLGTIQIFPTPVPVTVTGTIVDKFTGLPVSGADIYSGPASVNSQPDGSFTLPGVSVTGGSGELYIVADSYDYDRVPVSLTEEEIAARSKDVGTVELTPFFAGYVTDKVTGRPVSGVHLSLTDNLSVPSRTVGTSDGTGYYLMNIQVAGIVPNSGLRNTGFSVQYLTAAKDGYQPYTANVTDISWGDGTPYNIELVPLFAANFYAFGHVGQAPYSVRFMDQTTGSPTAWKWDFGDGTNSTEQNPTHIYNQTGVYNVALTASNDQMSDTAIQYRCIIVNTVPVAAFTANATSGLTPFTVQFTDQSSDATEYQWQFGDGATSTEQNPVHTYTNPGPYTVTLTVSAPDYGSAFTQKPGYITVSDPLLVGFSANVTAGTSPLAVQFNESTNGSVQYFFWHFGDGSTSSEQNPVHVYDTAGRYTVSLLTVGSNGTEVKSVENYINVTTPVTPTVTPTPTTQPLPVANFTVTTGAPGSLAIQVADSSVNATSVRYDLGDGTTTAYRNFQYSYWQAGTYTIEQTATNAAGTSKKTISVTVPPASVPTTTTTFPPIGGDQGWYTVHCNVDGASVLFDQTAMGTIAGGILKVRVYTTATPYRTFTVSKDGYTTFQGAITSYPGKDQNVDLNAQLTPTADLAYNGPHTIPGMLQAEDYNIGGEGVAYHDTTSGNTGGVYRHDDVDIEQLDIDGSPNVGWIRSGEWLTYTVNVTTAGTYNAGFRVASSHAGSSVQVYLDDGTTPVATVNVPNTGDWPVFQTVSVPVTLPAGQHRLKLAFPTDYVNINWINFVQSSGSSGMIL